MSIADLESVIPPPTPEGTTSTPYDELRSVLEDIIEELDNEARYACTIEETAQIQVIQGAFEMALWKFNDRGFSKDSEGVTGSTSK
jgi:hypothetical protein